MSWAGFIALSPPPSPPWSSYWWLQLRGNRLVDSKPYASYCSSLRPSSLRFFRQIRFNSACVFANAPRFLPYIRPCVLLQSWYHSGLSCHLRHLWSWRHDIRDWHFPEVQAETPPENLSVSQGRLCWFKGKLNYPFFWLSIPPPRVYHCGRQLVLHFSKDPRSHRQLHTT